jgi:hypothetical protein
MDRLSSLGAQKVRGTMDPEPTPVQNVSMDHRRARVAVTQQLLHRPDVVSGIQEMSRERVPEGVTGRPLGHPRGPDRPGYRPLHHRRVKVVPAPLPGLPFPIPAVRRKDPLPRPRARPPFRSNAFYWGTSPGPIPSRPPPPTSRARSRVGPLLHRPFGAIPPPGVRSWLHHSVGTTRDRASRALVPVDTRRTCDTRFLNGLP